MTSFNEIQAVVLDACNRKLDLENEFTINDPFQEWGFDSLDIIEIIMAMERQFNVRIPDEVTASLTSPYFLAKEIHNRLENA